MSIPASGVIDTSGAQSVRRGPAERRVAARTFPQRRLLIAGLAGALVLIAAAVLSVPSRPHGKSGDRPHGKSASSSTEPATPVPVPDGLPAGTYVVAARLHRFLDGRFHGIHDGGRVRKGDILTLQVQTSIPLFVYVVSWDDLGHDFVIFPATRSGLDIDNPISAGPTHTLPAAKTGWRVDGEWKSQRFLVWATPSRATDVEDKIALLPRPARLGEQAERLPLTRSVVRGLRGIGGLTEIPDQPEASVTSELDEIYRTATPLRDCPDTLTGPWVRRVELRSP